MSNIKYLLILPVALLVLWVVTRNDREGTARVVSQAPVPTSTFVPLGFDYSGAKLELQSILNSLDTPATAIDVVAAEMSFLDWVKLRTKNEKTPFESYTHDDLLDIMDNTQVWVLAFRTMDLIERDSLWMGSPPDPDFQQRIDTRATEVGYSEYRNPVTGWAIGVAVLRADTGVLLETGIYDDTPEGTAPPNIDVYAEIDALDQNN